MRTIGERLNYLIESQDINQTEFGKKIGVKDSALSEMITGKRAVGGIVLSRIAKEYPRFNLGWLLTGIGEAFIPFFGNNEGRSELQEPSEIYYSNPVDEYFYGLLNRPRGIKIIEDVVKKMIK